MVKIIFENHESCMIPDRLIERLLIEGATDKFCQVGERKYWAKDAEYISLEFKPSSGIIVDGLHNKDIIKRLDMFNDIVIIEVDGQTYYVPFFGEEINTYQNVEYLNNGNIKITIGKD